jgi:hypothetical protein
MRQLRPLQIDAPCGTALQVASWLMESRALKGEEARAVRIGSDAHVASEEASNE